VSQRDLFEDYKGDQLCYSGGNECVRTIGEVFMTQHGGSMTTVVKGVDLNSTDTSGIPAALAAASAADHVILCIGLGNDQEHEGIDRSDSSLPGQQQNFSQQILALGKPTIIVLINGGIVSIDTLITPAKGIIEAFYPGMRAAEALYSSIFGYTNRWGRLPVTIYPANFVQQQKMTNFDMTTAPGRTYRYYTGTPLFEFGFGLSYTEFAIGATLASDNITVNVNVKNVGSRKGDEVVMLYHRVSDQIKSSVNHPVPIRQLVDFNRVTVDSSAMTNFTFIINDNELALTNLNGEKVLYAGTHYLDVTDGSSTPTTISVVVTQTKIITS